MDSGSGGNRQEIQVCKSDNMESVMETMEEDIPKILSPELYDVFHIFTNMLDLKSFMKFAMTSKDMYDRCMKDKSIKINIDVDELEAKKENDSVVSSWSLDDDYAATLQKLPCKFNVRSVDLIGITEASEVIAYLKEIGVYRIRELFIHAYSMEWEAVITIMKNYGVKSLHIFGLINSDTDNIRAILQLKLEKLRFHPSSIECILEIDSPIREISIGVPSLTKENVMLISSRIQSGSLSHVLVGRKAIDWDEFDILPFDQEEPLPEGRPLILAKRDDMVFFDIYWFLHSNGGVTKCVMDSIFYCELYKCEPWEYPWILRKDEDVLKSIAEKEKDTLCSHNHFLAFWNGFEMLDPSHEGPLPTHRPLCCKISFNLFWMLDEGEKLMQCTWYDDFAKWNSYESLSSSEKEIKHPALAKHMFWHLLNKLEVSDYFPFHCEGHKEFHSWFNEFETVDFEYSGALPSTRPLIFEILDKDGMPWEARFAASNLRVVLLEDRLIECILNNESVEVKHCSYSNRPPVLFTVENVVEMLTDPHCDERRSYKISLEMFHDGFKLFTRSPSAIRKHLPIWERSTAKKGILVKEYWYEFDGRVRKVVWRKGRISFEKRIDLRDFPPKFMKEVFKYFAEHEPESCYHTFKLELEQLRSCLEQFTVLPFNYSGPLKTDAPLAFVKEEIRHTCRKGASRRLRCNCTDFSILVSFLWDGMKVTYCSWAVHEPKTLLFTDDNVHFEVLPALKSKEYLKNLLQGKYDKSSSYDWFGSVSDFRSCLNGYVKLPFNYDRQLPEERPIFFSRRSTEKGSSYFILREDGDIVECKKMDTSHFSLSLSSNKKVLPPALKRMF